MSQVVTKPVALDETLQATNTALGLLGKDTTLQSIVTALASIGINTVGNLASLVTTDKSSLVGAVNEVAGDVSDLDTDKADKVSGATNGNLAGLDGNGNLTDSGVAAGNTSISSIGDGTVSGAISTENSAIDAIVNAYGSKNLLKTTLSVGTIDEGDIRITVNEDGSLYIIGITDHQRWPGYADDFTVPYSGYYILSGNPGGGAYTLVIKDLTSSVNIGTDYGSGVKVYIDSTHNYQVYWYLPANIDISSGLTFKPMLRDARISDPTFAPYAMTNVELTRVSRKYLGYVVNGTSKQFTIPNAERGGVYIISIHNSYAAGVAGLLMLADELGSSIYIDLKSSEYFSITIDGVGIFTITAGQADGGVYCTPI